MALLMVSLSPDNVTVYPVSYTHLDVYKRQVITAVDKYADLLRMSAACPGNEARLGGNEAPPAIVSIFLGNTLTSLLKELAEGHTFAKSARGELHTGVKSLPLLALDDSDRNRTSPFAFTGNKFEFRMVGSSQSIGLANRCV